MTAPSAGTGLAEPGAGALGGLELGSVALLALLLLLALPLALARLARAPEASLRAALLPVGGLALAAGLVQAGVLWGAWQGAPLAAPVARVAAAAVALAAGLRLASLLARGRPARAPSAHEGAPPRDPHALRGQLHTIALQAALLQRLEPEALGEEGRRALRRMDEAVQGLASRLERTPP